jgi:hypothetical protein
MGFNYIQLSKRCAIPTFILKHNTPHMHMLQKQEKEVTENFQQFVLLGKPCLTVAAPFIRNDADIDYLTTEWVGNSELR